MRDQIDGFLVTDLIHLSYSAGIILDGRIGVSYLFAISLFWFIWLWSGDAVDFSLYGLLPT